MAASKANDTPRDQAATDRVYSNQSNLDRRTDESGTDNRFQGILPLSNGNAPENASRANDEGRFSAHDDTSGLTQETDNVGLRPDENNVSSRPSRLSN